MLDSDLWCYRPIESFILDDFTKSKISRWLIFSASETGNFWHYWFHCPVCVRPLLLVLLIHVTVLSSKESCKGHAVMPIFCVMILKCQEVVCALGTLLSRGGVFGSDYPLPPKAPEERVGHTDPLVLKKKLGRKWIIQKFAIPEVYDLWKENHLTSLCFSFFICKWQKQDSPLSQAVIKIK